MSVAGLPHPGTAQVAGRRRARKRRHSGPYPCCAELPRYTGLVLLLGLCSGQRRPLPTSTLQPGYVQGEGAAYGIRACSGLWLPG
jgi:hypothetical protein